MSGHRTEADYAAQICQLADQNRALRSELAAALAAVRDAWNIIEGDTETTEGWAERNASIIAVAQRKEKS